MNTTTRIAAIALSFFAAGAALADDPTIEPVVPKTSTVTRAQVQAELAQARANGLLLVNDAVGVPAAPLLSQKTRAEVRAELMEAIANGDLQYIDLIAKHCKGMDVMGSNVYRGISARDFFQVVKDKLGVPVIFTEFGSDAFNARTNREDQAMQARYLLGQWQEIFAQSAGKGRGGNAAGGPAFQWGGGGGTFKPESLSLMHISEPPRTH